MKDFTCVRLPKLTCEFMAVRNIQSIYQYFESAHGQLASFIRLTADEGVKRFHYNFVAAKRLMEVNMCEANVYLVDETGKEELILDSVDKVIPDENGITLENIYSERKTLRARIKLMELVEHRIILENLD